MSGCLPLRGKEQKEVIPQAEGGEGKKSEARCTAHRICLYTVESLLGGGTLGGGGLAAYSFAEEETAYGAGFTALAVVCAVGFCVTVKCIPYKGFVETVNKLSITQKLFSKALEEGKKQNDELGDKVDEMEVGTGELAKQLGALKLENEASKTNNAELEQKVTQFEADINEAKNTITRIEAERVRLEALIPQLLTVVSKFSEGDTGLQDIISKYKTSIEALGKTQEKNAEKLAAQNEELSSLTTELSQIAKGIGEDLKKSKLELDQFKVQVGQLKEVTDKLEKTAADLKAAETRLKQVKKEVKENEAYVTQLITQSTQLLGEIEMRLNGINTMRGLPPTPVVFYNDPLARQVFYYSNPPGTV